VSKHYGLLSPVTRVYKRQRDYPSEDRYGVPMEGHLKELAKQAVTEGYLKQTGGSRAGHTEPPPALFKITKAGKAFLVSHETPRPTADYMHSVELRLEGYGGTSVLIEVIRIPKRVGKEAWVQARFAEWFPEKGPLNFDVFLDWLVEHHRCQRVEGTLPVVVLRRP
jgi:hypothetical protein